MKRIFLVFCFLSLIGSTVLADELDSLLFNLNVQSKNDEVGFKSNLAVTFGVPQTKVEFITKNVDNLADAYMVLRLSQMTNRLPDQVISVYQKNKNKGWGNIAKELGIKPGSKEFQELKQNKMAMDKGNKSGKEKHKGKGKY